MASDDSTTDERLLRRFVSDGDERSFEELMRRHEGRVFAVALRMTGERADALDATQETFIAAFRQAPSFRGDSAFGTWLYRIAVNSCHDLMRKRKRWGDPHEDPPELPSRSAGVDDAVALRLDVARALAALQPEYREAVALYDLGGIPYEEIARITGTNLGTVKSRISRGRRRLAEILELPGRAATSKDST